MKLRDIAEELGLKNLTPEIHIKETFEVRSGHVSDLLSDVLAHAPSGGVLVTIQAHMNVIAVSVHAGLAAIIFASGMSPDETVRIKAVEEQMPLFSTDATSFEIVGKLYSLGLRGTHA